MAPIFVAGKLELIGVLGGCGGSSEVQEITSVTVGEGLGDFIADCMI